VHCEAHVVALLERGHDVGLALDNANADLRPSRVSSPIPT
jgi:hypothetical protein